MAEANSVLAIATEGKNFIRYVANDIPEGRFCWFVIMNRD